MNRPHYSTESRPKTTSPGDYRPDEEEELRDDDEGDPQSDRSDTYPEDAEPQADRAHHADESLDAAGLPDKRLREFWSYLPQHKYLYLPTRDLWPIQSVNSRIPAFKVLDEHGNPVLDESGKVKRVKAGAWLDQHRAVEAMTWCPGLPTIIENKVVNRGGWVDKRRARTLNRYLPPTLSHGDARQADPWLDHLFAIYPNEADHIIDGMAHRVQCPGTKCNHAIVLTGPPGIGKDSILEPLKHAVGPWNFSEIGPDALFEAFNPHLESVVIRVSEAHDLGDVNRFGFHERTKALIAAPPDVLTVNEKHVKQYPVFNVAGVVFTSNHRDPLYLPSDDRRHFVCWSESTQDDFNDDYWTKLWTWYQDGGNGHVAAYLADHDLQDFSPTAPPRKTAAFWTAVDANRSPECAELADALESLGHPPVVTLDMVAGAGPLATDFSAWVKDRRNAKAARHRLEEAGYPCVVNTDARDSYWSINGRRQAVYGCADLQRSEHIDAIDALRREPMPHV